jgi:lipopolysaccharide/colanic/teichoic acid biosynthesis glycosyltransferase
MIRFFDLFFSLMGIILLFPFLIVISIFNVSATKGRIFYFQRRVGRYGKEFYLIKFRTMHLNSDKKSLLTIGSDDKRITKTGNFLRKHKLDEIPQLINVIAGEMSLVGPRPEVPKYVELYNDQQRQVLSCRPGITDYASIEFVNENEILRKSADPEKTYILEILPRKIELNMKFISDPSIRQYFKILFLTVKEIFG